MTTTPIFLLAPAAGMEYIAMPSGTTYVANNVGLVIVTNGSVQDQQALIAAGCTALLPNVGGVTSTQPGSTYTVQASDQNNVIVFTSPSIATVTLPNNLPEGFAVELFQGGTGGVSAQAAGGGSVVTPNASTTFQQYGSLICLVIANTTGASAQWDVVASPTNTGSGLIGASTLSSLYSQDTTSHYAQYSVAQVFSDGTASNDGIWLKTGSGSGSGNWTQQASVSLSTLATQVAGNTGAIAALNAAIQVGALSVSAETDGLQAFRLCDGLGFYVDYYAYATALGFQGAGLSLISNLLNAGTFSILTENDGSDVLHVADPLGFYVVPQISASPSDALVYAPRNASNLASGTGAERQVASTVCALAPGLNHMLIGGQSLAQGEEGWPSLSTTTVDGNKMIGNSVRSQSATTYSPYGSSALTPLVSTTEQNGVILTTTQQQALTWPASPDPFGENAVVGAANMLKILHNRHVGANSDPSRTLCASAVGVPNQCIENLMKGATTGYWGQVTSAVSQGKALAAGASEPYVLPAFLWMQGEGNYATGLTAGGASIDNTRAGYLAKLQQLRTDLITDCVTGNTAQTDSYGNEIPPAFFTYQTAREFVSDFSGGATALSISMAQYDFSVLTPGCYLVGPDYPVTGVANHHLDANGYRWMGMQFAKVMHRVLDLRQKWKPLAPKGLTQSGIATTGFVLNGNILSIDFNVPEPPLVFDSPYVGYTPTLYADRGFTVTDASGHNPVVAVRIVYDTIVELTLTRAPVGTTYVLYGDATYHSGYGNLRDSDPFASTENYYYASGSGQQTAANIAALAGKPYPLFNWCILFNQQIQ